MTRYAKVYGNGVTQGAVQNLLPAGYAVLCTHDDDGIVICGVDQMGWTLTDYVLPRLESAGFFAREVTRDELDTESVRCHRCGAVIQEREVDRRTVWESSTGSVACLDYHGHDSEGMYAPMHSPTDDGDSTVVHDTEDRCVQEQLAMEA